MSFLMLFTGWLFGCCAVAFIIGGSPERLAAATMLVATALSFIVRRHQGHDFSETEWTLFAIDFAVQLALVWLAVRADRFWPITAAGIHLSEILAHLAQMLTHRIDPGIYARAEVLGSYLVLGLILIGSLNHHRRRKRAASTGS